VPLSSPIFRKLLLSAFVLVAVTLGPLGFYLTQDAVARHRESTRRQLAAEARILAGEMDKVEPAQLAAWTQDAARRSESRITVIDPKGNVIADSEYDQARMEDHAGRPEVSEARQGKTGFAVRRSGTLGVEMSYAAVPVTYRGQPGYVLRTALPMREVADAAAAVRWRILAASLLAALIALAMAYWFSRTFTRRIRRLQAFADSLLGARTAESLAPDSDDELGALAGSLSRTADQLRDLFDKLSMESSRREAILASMMEGVLAVDHELRVTFCNEAFARAVGARMPVPSHLPVLELVRDPAFLDLLSRVLATNQTFKHRLQLAAAEGRVFEVQAAPLTAGTRRGAIAILHDITDLERLERVRRDFVGNVSHELRTPLTAIRGYAETLLEGALEDQENNRKFLEIIRAHAIRLNNIASDLLVLSELESGQPATPPEAVSIREALESALRTVESEAHIRNVALKPGRLEDAAVAGYRIRLEQAFVNLLDNAVKFNRPGGEVRIETGRTPEGAAQVIISDTGIGIPSDDLPRIFERFYRVDKARSRDVGGTGLGLSIVKHVIERMNGTVTVESKLGKGSVFTVTLPALDSAAAQS